MDRNYGASGQIADVAEYYMRPMLSFDDEPGFLKSLHQASTGNLGQDAQAATSTCVVRMVCSEGIGSPSSRRLMR